MSTRDPKKARRTLEEVIACGSLAAVAAPATAKFAEARAAKDAAEAALVAAPEQIASSNPRTRFAAQDTQRDRRRAARIAEFDLTDARRALRAALGQVFHDDVQPAFQIEYARRLADVGAALDVLHKATALVVELEAQAQPFTLPSDTDVAPSLSPLGPGEPFGERLTASIRHFSEWLGRLRPTEVHE